jgi:hypothetical protein
MSSVSLEAKTKYDNEKTVDNARNYFREVLLDNSSTNLEKRDAAYAYTNKTTNNTEKNYAKRAADYYNNPTIWNAYYYILGVYYSYSQIIPEERFKSYFDIRKGLPWNYYGWKRWLKQYQLDPLYNSIIYSNSKWKESIIQIYDSKPDPNEVKYKTTKATYTQIKVSGTYKEKYDAAKAYYDAAKAYSATNPQQKYEAAKAYHEEAEAWGETTTEQKLVAVTAYRDTARAYYDSVTNQEKYNVASDFFGGVVSHEGTTPSEKYDAAKSWYEVAMLFGKVPEKYTAAKEYYEATISYETTTADMKYTAAKAFYDRSFASNSNSSDMDKSASARACYDTALLLENNETLKYTAAKNLLDFINQYPQDTNSKISSDIAKTIYNNSPSGVKFNSAKEWYGRSADNSKTEAAKAYYTESKSRSCNDKCTATNAYYKNGGSTDTNISYENTYYTGLMGDDCNTPKNICDISGQKTEGFNNREPMTQCRQDTQKQLFKSAENAYKSYDTTPNQRYSELDTINTYFELATKENGLNSEDIMNAAKNRVNFIKSMKTIDYDKLTVAAKVYDDAADALDCGSDISYNKYLAVKTYYEVLEKGTNESEKLKISKKYYKYTVNANRSNAERYTVAKIWFANSEKQKVDILDAARAVYYSAIPLDSGATNDEFLAHSLTYKKYGGNVTLTEKSMLASRIASLSNLTDQPESIQYETALSAYITAMKVKFGPRWEPFTVTNFSTKPTSCDCTVEGRSDECKAYCVYESALTPKTILNAAQNWSGVNYQKDIVDKRKELDVELSKLDNNAATQIQKMDLDTTIMMNIAATVLASSLIVFSITKL